MSKISRRRMIGLIAATVSAPGAGLASSRRIGTGPDPNMTVTNPRCEYLTNPLGIGEAKPRLSWLLNSPRRGARQTAYQILVASSPELLAAGHGDWWGSGKVAGDQTAQVEYGGRPLRSRDRCFWKVRAWGAHGKATAWSPVAHWTMGLLTPDAWSAQWIGMGDGTPDTPEPASALLDANGLALPRRLRTTFRASKPIRRATAYVTALGLYELRLNGSRVGDHLLAPEWTNYHKRIQYQIYDVTASVRSGENVLAATLGNGWYCGLWQHWPPRTHLYGTEPYLLAQLEAEFEDGTRQTVVSDGAWRGTTEGPLRFSGIYEGETYDARREMPGWDAPGFDDAAWPPVKIGHDLSPGRLVAQRSPPIRATQEITAITVTEPKPGVHVFDLGQNIAGWCRLCMTGAVGQTVTLRHNETLNPDGTVYMDNLHAGHMSAGDRQVVRYTFRGDGMETYEPHFTYQGFRYVQVEGLTERPLPEAITGRVFHTDCPEVGGFTCSEPLVNRLAENIRWSQRANFMGVPTDCPQRDERCGYTGDAQFFMPTAIYNMDIAAFFSKWLTDVCEDSQRADGGFADHAPDFGAGGSQNVGWLDAGIICPYLMYRTYGDTRIIRDHYAAMKRCLQMLVDTSKDDSRDKIGNGDWLNLGGGASNTVIGTAYYAYDCRVMAEMAEAIGEAADAAVFRARAARVASAFAATCIGGDGSIEGSSQTGYALAYTMGLVPPALREKVAVRFAEQIARFGGHLATGFIGTPRLLPALHLAGRDDLAYQLLLQRTYPSWLYEVTLGATTMWERWDGWTPGHGYQNSGMNSFNHYSFGAVGQYLFGMVGGIQGDAPGYKRIRIQPVIENGLTWARASYQSIQGLIVSHWRRDGADLTLEVTIPANTTATVFVPALDGTPVSESGRPLRQAHGVSGIGRRRNCVLFAAQSGTYRFQSRIAG